MKNLLYSIQILFILDKKTNLIIENIIIFTQNCDITKQLLDKMAKNIKNEISQAFPETKNIPKNRTKVRNLEKNKW